MRISDWSSDVCSSELDAPVAFPDLVHFLARRRPGPRYLDKPHKHERIRACLRDVARQVEHLLALAQVLDDFFLSFYRLVPWVFLVEEYPINLDRIHVSFRRHRLPPANYASMCALRSEEHTSELQSLMRISYAVFCLKKKK